MLAGFAYGCEEVCLGLEDSSWFMEKTQAPPKETGAERKAGGLQVWLSQGNFVTYWDTLSSYNKKRAGDVAQVKALNSVPGATQKEKN